MRIAQIAPYTEAVPPQYYGGTERVVSWLTEELVALGHDVTLFASGDSVTSAKLESIWEKALRLDTDAIDSHAIHMSMLELVKRQAQDFDLLHFHIDYFPFSLFMRQKTPFVTTLHGRLDLREHQIVFRTFESAPVVAVSNSQRLPVPFAGWVGTVYHGLPEKLHRPSYSSQNYLAFLGRTSPGKGVDTAIRLALRAGLPLKIAAKVDKVDADYFEQRIRPMLDRPDIEFVGEINDREKTEFLGGARALLFPITWPEPFGLVMIEAMACGTPVIAFNMGSVPEIIENNLTGFIVKDEDEASAAIEKLPQLSRKKIRQRFEERFTARRMALNYLDVYRQLMEIDRLENFRVNQFEKNPVSLNFSNRDPRAGNAYLR